MATIPIGVVLTPNDTDPISWINFLYLSSSIELPACQDFSVSRPVFSQWFVLLNFSIPYVAYPMGPLAKETLKGISTLQLLLKQPVQLLLALRQL